MRLNSNITLEELYNTNSMALLMKSIAELAGRQDYNTLNTLLRRNPNINMFDTRLLNKVILSNVVKYTD